MGGNFNNENVKKKKGDLKSPGNKRGDYVTAASRSWWKKGDQKAPAARFSPAAMACG